MSKLLCWLIRMAGGKHAWRRPRKKEYAAIKMLPGVISPHQTRICDRCEALRAVKPRVKKETA